MSVIKGAIHWAGEHPVVIAVGVFGIGALFLLTRGGGGQPAAANLSSFYAAQAAQAQAGAVIQTTQIQADAAQGIAKISADRDTSIAGIQAPILLAQNDTAQQAQKQQFFLDTGIQQIFGAQLPYLVANFAQGGTSALAAEAAIEAYIHGGTGYSAAH